MLTMESCFFINYTNLLKYLMLISVIYLNYYKNLQEVTF